MTRSTFPPKPFNAGLLLLAVALIGLAAGRHVSPSGVRLQIWKRRITRPWSGAASST